MEKIIIDPKKEIDDYRDLRRYYKGDFKPAQIRIEDFANAKRFVIQPDFQRLYVWNIQKASALIESILLSIPVPAMYTYLELATGKELVIDGQQRLTTIKRFLENGFKLQSLKVLKHLNGLSFYQLDKELQTRILTYDLTIICLKNIDNKKIIFDIFEKFNTGGMRLNQQEIRNCLYSGQYNNYIRHDLVKYENFSKLMEKFNPKRFLKEELVVRFLALYDDLDGYKGNMSAFLNKHYEDRQYLDDFSKIDFENYIKEDKKRFKDCIDACKIVFGANAFKSIDKYDTPVNGKKYGFAAFSKLVFDMQMQGFVDFDLAYIHRYADKIREAYIETVLRYPEMAPVTANNNKLTAERIKKWQDCIGKIIYQ